MTAAAWFVIAGVLFVGMALASSTIKRLPLTTALLYICIGFLLGPQVSGFLILDPIRQAPLLERLTEIVVIVSLFSAGLKLRAPLRGKQWIAPVRLATVSMTLTVGMIAAAAVYWLGLSLGAAVLLGAILAPTDPVLASDVQVGHAFDKDRLRFSLTGEAGLNDGTAFPFVMLGLGLLGLHDLGESGWRWFAVDVLWAGAGGFAIGTVTGALLGRLVVYLRRRHRQALGTDDFIAIGVIALAYGVALLCHTYGFLAVFAAGLAIRRVEMRQSFQQGAEPADERPALEARDDQAAVHPQRGPAYMAEAIRHVTEIFERVGEIVVVLIVGALLSPATMSWRAALFAVILIAVVRPVAVIVGMLGSRTLAHEISLTAWFGIRGIGSIYYLMYAVVHGLDPALSAELITLTLTTVALSTAVHGATVTPLMNRHRQRTGQT